MPQRTTQHVRFERIRCALARHTFRTTIVAGVASASLAPKYHPWRRLATSALEDLHSLTTATLTPRNGTSTVKARPKHRLPLKATIATYLVAVQFFPLLPGIVLIPDGPKIQPLEQLGITEEPVVAPRLRVYVTPQRSHLEPIQASLNASG